MTAAHRIASWQVTAALLGAALVGPARADDIDRFIAQEQRLYDLPAVVAGVIQEGRLTDARASGLVNVELGVKASTDHVFEIGSISKQFTAYAILILRDEGKLELDAPVGRYLTELPEPWGRVRLHRLLTHTSGLPDLEEAFGYDVYRQTPSDADFLERLLALPIGFEPGDKWQYSNTNYWLLARVIEKTSGLSYAEFMQRRVFVPLGMRSTRSALPGRLLPNRASGYQRVHGILENRDAIRSNTGRGLGDIATTLGDMALWEREQLSPRLLSPAAAALARQPVVLNDGKVQPYGYGWSTASILPVATLSHEGQTAGFTASYIRVPDRHLAAVVFVNAFSGDPSAIGIRLLGQVDPSLRPPPFEAVGESDPDATALVRKVLATAAAADVDWREEWFSPPYWREIRPWLREIAEGSRTFGLLESLSPVGVAGARQEDARTRIYRAVYGSVSRIVTFRFDQEGRISGRDGVDE
jgi:CubicO group peptidase (beta-lactamase class C family)